MKVEGLASH